jgi:carbon monoxide dehydrogenase subunit G
LETKLSISIEIEVAPEKVFAFLTSEKLNYVMKDYVKEKWTSERPVGVGSVAHVVGVGGVGNKAEWDNTVTEFVENKNLTMHSVGRTKDALDSTQSFALEPTTKGTKVTYSMDYEMPYSLLGKLADELVFSREFKREFTKILENLKKALEGVAPAIVAS